MVKRSRVIRALVLGGTIATGFALNSTSAFAAEVDEEPQDNAEQVDETQSSADLLEVAQDNTVPEYEESLQAQDESIQKMEDATEVVEGDLVAEEGYLEEANNAIEAEEMTFERADELLENGEAVLNQAEEKNKIVEEEYAKVEEETNEVGADFRGQATEFGFEDLAEKVDSAESIQEMIDLIDKSKETCVSEYAREVEACQEYQKQINDSREQLEINAKYLEQYQKEYEEAEKEYDDAYAEYYRMYYWFVEYSNVLRGEQRELWNTIASLEAEIKNNEGNPSVLEELQAKKEEAEIKYQELEEELLDLDRSNGDYYWVLQVNEEYELEPYKDKIDEAYSNLSQTQIHTEECEWEINECTAAIEESTSRQAVLLAQIENHDKIQSVSSYYIKSLKKNDEAKALVNQSNAAYKNVENTYEELKRIIVEYKELHLVEHLIYEIQKDESKEEDTLNDAKATIADKQMTDDKAAELLDIGKKVLDDAQKKYEEVKDIFSKADEETNLAADEFKAHAKSVEKNEYIERLDAAESIQEKIAVLDEVERSAEDIEILQSEYDELEKSINQINTNVDALNKEIEKASEEEKTCCDAYEKAKADYENAIERHYREYNRVVRELDKAHKEMGEIDEKKATLTYEISSVDARISELNEEIKAIDKDMNPAEYEAKKNELDEVTRKRNGLKEEMDAANERYNYLAGCCRSYDNYIYCNYDYLVRSEKEYTEPYYKKMQSASAAWNQAQRQYNKTKETNEKKIEVLLEELTGSQKLKDEIVGKINYHDEFIVYVVNYKTALENYSTTKSLFDASEDSLEKASSTYNELSSIIDEYKKTQSQEPEVTEVTTKNTFTTKVAQTIRNFFTGVTAVVDGTITTETTTVSKTITDKVTKVKKTIVSTHVNLVANACVKLYDRFGRLITTLYDNVNVVYHIKMPFITHLLNKLW